MHTVPDTGSCCAGREPLLLLLLQNTAKLASPTATAQLASCLDIGTLCQLLGKHALLLLLLVLALDAHDTTAPLHTRALVELVLEGLNQLAELTLVLILHTGHAQSSCVLLVHNGTQASLTLKTASRTVAYTLGECCPMAWRAGRMLYCRYGPQKGP
eukprot:GHUV01029980.1.p1 GENE.GHUV01029980.1~~GHUV01029980.1.p1  ORF type:complete len:157 (+),score=22.36 GHUV01029980.1:290-760(+)